MLFFTQLNDIQELIELFHISGAVDEPALGMYRPVNDMKTFSWGRTCLV